MNGCNAIQDVILILGFLVGFIATGTFIIILWMSRMNHLR
jgi:hypothetical protein